MDNGKLLIRRSIQIAAPPERVWREFESHDAFSRWWATAGDDRSETVPRYEPRVGGMIEFAVTSGGGDITFAGRVLNVEPARELSFELEFLGQDWLAPTTVTVRLTPNAYGTLVEILHYGFERIGAGAVEQFHAFEGGWDLRELRQLRSAVESAVAA
jgi:uncharacterized protein YndB with AHSA1/START domain